AAAVTVTSTATISDPSVNAGGVAVSAVGGAAFSGKLVATFTDPGGAEALADYSAVIDWGDGSTATAGAISYDSSSDTFSVKGDHAYVEEGSRSVSVSVHDGATSAVTVTSTATISDPSVSAIGVAVSAVEAVAFTGKVVAT